MTLPTRRRHLGQAVPRATTWLGFRRSSLKPRPGVHDLQRAIDPGRLMVGSRTGTSDIAHQKIATPPCCQCRAIQIKERRAACSGLVRVRDLCRYGHFPNRASGSAPPYRPPSYRTYSPGSS